MQNYSFHDSTLVKFKQDKNNIILNIEDIYSSEGKKMAEIICHDVTSSKMDHQNCVVSMFYQDSEILDLEIEGNTLKLVINWYDYENKNECTKYYEIDCKSIELNFS